MHHRPTVLHAQLSEILAVLISYTFIFSVHDKSITPAKPVTSPGPQLRSQQKSKEHISDVSKSSNIFASLR